MIAQSSPEPSTLVDWAVAARAMPGQSVSGDLHLVQPFADGVLFAVVDGLGHGAEAGEVARLAVRTLSISARTPLAGLVTRCHDALRSTRGAVMSLASIDTRRDSLTWVGVGNVHAVVIRRHASDRSHEGLVLRGGIVGHQLPPLRVSTLHLSHGDTLVLATDGIRSGFAEALAAEGSPARLAESILSKFARDTDDALVLVGRYLGGSR